MAQVLPVLLLAAVVDVRRARALKSSQLLLPIFVFLLGEVNSLNIIAFSRNHGTTWDYASVMACFIATTSALVLAVLADIATPRSDEPIRTMPPEHPTLSSNAGGLDRTETGHPPHQR
jgi:hypothetical protein